MALSRMSRETEGYDFVQFIDGHFAISCKPEIVRSTKKCTLVQFFFGKVCKCAFFFVPLWGNLEKCADTASINIFVPLRLCACTSAVGSACELFVRGLRCHAWRRYCHTARQGRAALQNNGTRCGIYPYEIRQFDDLCRGRI